MSCRVAVPLLAGVLAVLGAGPGLAAQGGPAVESAAQPAAPMRTLSLGMSYIVPPHLPGAKVRTPEGLAPLLAERLGRDIPVKAVHTPVASGAPVTDRVMPQLDALLVKEGAVDSTQAAVIPTGYRAGIMAIMRTDTDIRSWEDLRDRTVCLTEGGGLAGTMQARYGAVEKVFRAPADALLDLRIGGCDAAVHDSTMLEALLEFPEWQKFSARLPIQEERDLVFVVPGQDADVSALLQSHVQQWQQNGLLAKLTAQAARDIAFEVYMDQEVPDCH